MARQCYLCGQADGQGPRECRPYGPDGKGICAGCMFGEDGKPPDPKVQTEVRERLRQIMRGPGPHILITDNHDGIVRLSKGGRA